MKHGEWTRPQFRELNLSAEIGMYAEDSGDPYLDDASAQALPRPHDPPTPDACA